MTNIIRLTAFEVEIATDLGMTIQEYAKAKKQIMQQQIEHEKWLQTPAGVAYMARRQAAYEKKLIRDRAYSKAYRAKKKKEN